MKVQNLFNVRKLEFENVESFSKRLYETIKRYRGSMILNERESWYVINLLSKYYKEEWSDILSIIRDIEYNQPSKKYLIQYVQCLGKHYLMVEKRG